MFGSPRQELVMMFLEDSLQSTISGEWWIKNSSKKICRGALVFSFSPHIDQIPYGFEPIGRTNATEHDSATVRVSALKVDQPLKQTKLPVAAMPLNEKEVWAAYRAKVRPCLVFSSDSICKTLNLI